MLKSFFNRHGQPQDGQGFSSSLLPRPSLEMLRLLPRSFDSMEVWVLMFCGLFGLLISFFLMPGITSIKLLCVGFLLLGIVKRVRPSRTKNQWFISGLFSLVITLIIHMAPGSGGSMGPFYFLLILLAISYPLLLENEMAFVFGLLLLGAMYLGTLNLTITPARELVFLRGLLIAGICLLAARCGALLRFAEEAMDAMRRDKQSLAYNEYGLNFYGGMLMRRSIRKGKKCCLILLRMPMDWMVDVLQDVETVDQKHVYTLAVRDIATHLGGAVPDGTLLARASELDWVLIVPGMTPVAAIERMVNAFGRPLQIPFGAKQHEWFVVITPCGVPASAEECDIPALLIRAQDIWERGLRTGVA